MLPGKVWVPSPAPPLHSWGKIWLWLLLSLMCSSRRFLRFFWRSTCLTANRNHTFFFHFSISGDLNNLILKTRGSKFFYGIVTNFMKRKVRLSVLYLFRYASKIMNMGGGLTPAGGQRVRASAVVARSLWRMTAHSADAGENTYM